MNIIVAGAGKAGTSIIKRLAEGDHNITMIDKDNAVLSKASDMYDVMTVNGNCITADSLQEAGVEQAELLIAFTGSDETNLLCCLLAKKLNARIHTIPRIRNPEFNDIASKMRQDLGISMVVNPDRDAAREINLQLQFPAFLKRDSFARGRVEIVQIRISGESKIKNIPINSLSAKIGCKVLVCAVVHGGRAVIPNGDYVIKSGDDIYVTAPTDVLSLLVRKLGLTKKKIKHIMIVGGDRISVYLAKMLMESGVHIKIIENDPQRCAQLSMAMPSATVICGDGSSQDVLDREGCSTVDALITLTGLDEVNMVVSMYGSSIGVEQVITKINRIESPALLGNLNIGSVISSTHISGENIGRYVHAMTRKSGEAQSIHPIANGQAEAMEFHVDENSMYTDIPLKDVPIRKNVILSCIIRKGRSIIPDGSTVYQQGDTVVVTAGADESICQFNDIFSEQA